MKEPSAYPVRAFYEHTRALEAAMSVCLGDPARETVHALRSSCTRVEADLKLLGSLAKLPTHRAEAQKVLKELKPFRRAAGRVRDFDVERKLLKQNFLKASPAHPVDAALQQESTSLRRRCKRGRKKAAKKLLRVIRNHQAALSSALEALAEKLREKEALAISTSTLLHAVDAMAHDATRGKPLQPANASNARLHELRKLAKRARYQAELGGASALALQQAEALRQLQDVGGAWHDWWQLAEFARAKLGKKKPAALEFAQREAEHRKEFGRLLLADPVFGVQRACKSRLHRDCCMLRRDHARYGVVFGDRLAGSGTVTVCGEAASAFSSVSAYSGGSWSRSGAGSLRRRFS